MARAFVSGDLTVEGDLYALLRGFAAHRRATSAQRPTRPARGGGAARRLGAIGPPLPAPPEEAVPPAGSTRRSRDAEVISHHYDVGNDFYRLVLGPSMTYSCARFVTGDATLEDAQAAKHELICRKLGIVGRPGSRLLDVGCGWGSMAIHAARHHRATVVGVALSREQVDEATRRVAEAGLEDRVEIRLQDYRDLRGRAVRRHLVHRHVRARRPARMARYFETLRALLGPTGRLLNHAISTPGGSRLGRRTFIGRYVFPDGELIDVAEVVLAMERAGFEVRDVESLREHYRGRCTPGSPTSRTTGTRRWRSSGRPGPASGACTWRRRPTASTTGAWPSTRCSGSSTARRRSSGMPPTRGGWG